MIAARKDNSRLRDPEQTRAELLQAAFKEVHENGFQAASLQRILANTNLTKGALYHHFPNKCAMGLAVLDEVVGKRIYQSLIAPLEQVDDPVPVLLKIIDEEIDFITDEGIRLGCPMMNLSQEMSPLDDEFREHLLRIFEGWRTALADALGRGQEKGTIRQEVNCDQASIFFIATYEGSIGIGKTYQSAEVVRSCATQLKVYLESLQT